MLRTIAFVVMMVAGLGAAVWSRFGALLFYLWFALFRPQEWIWFDVTQYRLSLIVGILLVVPSLLSGILPNLSHPLSIGSLVFLSVGLVAQIGAVRPDIGWQWLDFLMRLILVCLLLVTMVNTKRRFIVIVAVIAGSFGYYPAKAGLASLLGGGVQFFMGLGGAFTDNNGYALGSVLIMPLLLATGQNLSKHHTLERWLRIGFFVAVPLSAYTVVSLFSRGGFLALVAATVALVVLQRRRLAAVALLVVFLAVALAIIPIQEGYVDRLKTIQTYDEIEETSAISRLHFWRVAVDMARQQPLGVGLWNFQPNYDRYDWTNGRYGTERSVHSSHFQVLAETGFGGALVWIVLFAVAFRVGLRIRRRAGAQGLGAADRRFLLTMSNALMASMCGFLAGGSFIALALNDLTWLTFALIAALDRLSASMIAGQAVEGGTPASAPAFADRA